MSVSCRGLRLLLVGPYPPPFGGVASHLTNLVPGLTARGADDVAIISFGDKNEVTTVEGAVVYRVKVKDRAIGLVSLASMRGPVAAATGTLGGAGLEMRQIIAEATRAKVIDDVARNHDSNVASFYQADLSLSMLPVARLWGKQRGLVLTVFGEAYDTPDFFAARVPLFSNLINLPNSVVTSSRHCARSFSTLGISREIEAVYYGVDLERFQVEHLREPYRAEIGIAPDDVLVVFMGRFSKEMGLDRVLEVAPAVFARQPTVKLLLCGAKGELSERVETFARAHANRARILNDVPFAKQPAIYAAADMVLAPTADQHACMGMSIKEAMAASRPVVGSIAGGIPEAIVAGATGLLVPLDPSKHIDAAGLESAILTLAGDAALRRRMGTAGRRRAEDIFAHDRTNDRMAQLFMAARPTQ